MSSSLLRELLKIDTVDSKGGEEVISSILRYLEGCNFDYTLLEFEGVKNLVAYNSKHVKVAFNGHYDVVPPSSGWSFDPFSPVERDGFIYARGASDMKGGLAAAVAAFKDALNDGIPVALIVNGDEEKGGFKGAKPTLESVTPWLQIDAAVVAEPTSKEKAVDRIRKGARGVIWLEVEIMGSGGHASRPREADNPLDAVALLIERFKSFEFEEFTGMESTTLCPTSVESNSPAMNVIPSKAVLRVDVRNNASVNEEQVKEAISTVLDDAGFEHTVSTLLNEPPFYSDDEDFESILSTSVEEVCGSPPKFFTGGGSSDARFFSAKGIPAYEVGVVPRNMHAADEHVSVEELRTLERVFSRLLSNL